MRNRQVLPLAANEHFLMGPRQLAPYKTWQELQYCLSSC